MKPLILLTLFTLWGLAMCSPVPAAELTPITMKKETSLYCLAKNLYHEARGEGFIGMVAVGLVTKHRVQSKEYPNTYEGVIYQPYAFSWTLKHPPIKDQKAFEQSLYIAKKILEGYDMIWLPQVTHYHATNILPAWASTLTKVGTIRHHTFYTN